MYRLFSFAIVFCSSWLLASGVVFAYERVVDFTSDIVTNADGTFQVTETIIYDFETLERHGIYRNLPLTHPQPASQWYKNRIIDIDVDSVTRNGEVVPYTESVINKSREIKIGDPEVLIAGQHTYVLQYTVNGGYFYYPTQNPELFWNVTGHDWNVPIMKATAILHDPTGMFVNQRACYRGIEGETTSCGIPSATTTITFTARELLPGEGMTVAQAFAPGSAAVVILESTPSYIWLAPALFVLLIALVSWVYRYKTYHRPSTPIVTQFGPFPDVLPMYTGVLIDGKLDPKDITAGLVYLAQQGFIKIRKTERKILYLFEVDDYEVELLRNIEDSPTKFHIDVLNMMFQGDAGEVVALSGLKSDKSKQRSNSKILAKLHAAIADDVVERAFYERAFKLKYIVVAVAVAIIFMQVIFTFITHPNVIFGIILAVVVFFIILLATYRRRTVLGYQALHHLKGFKEFLSVTEKDRLAFHNAPAKNPVTYMEYLPYAIALGVEKEWSEVFKDITIPTPSWYEGGAHGAFSAVALSRDVGAFSTEFASSSGTGSSGSGSSGGGSGGGGGGSW